MKQRFLTSAVQRLGSDGRFCELNLSRSDRKTIPIPASRPNKEIHTANQRGPLAFFAVNGRGPFSSE